MSVFAVYIENVKSGQKKYVDSSSLREIRDSPLDDWDFKPKDKSDFKPNTYYGKLEPVDGVQTMVKYYILRMGGK